MVTAQNEVKENFQDQVFKDMDLVDVDDPLTATMERDIASLDLTHAEQASPLSKLFSNIPLFIAALLIAVIGFIVFQTLETQQSATKAQYGQTTSQLMMLSQGIAKDAREAVFGNNDAFDRLREQSDRFASEFNTLGVGGSSRLLSPALPDVTEQIEPVSELWSATQQDVDTILVHQQVLLNTPGHLKRINELAPLLLTHSDEVVEAVVRESRDPEQVNIAGRQRSLSQRIAKNVNIFAQGGSEAAVAATQVGKDTRLFELTSQQLRQSSGPVVQAKLDTVDVTFGELKTAVYGLLGSVTEFFLAQSAAENIVDNSVPLLASVKTLSDTYTDESHDQISQWLPWVFGALGVLFLFRSCWMKWEILLMEI